MKRLFIAAVIAAVFSTPTIADNLFTPEPVKDWSYTFSYNFYTFHHNSKGYTKDGVFTLWNETNNIVGFRVNVNENVGYFVGGGKNSYYNTTTMLGMELSTGDHRMFEVGSDVGMANGYEAVVDFGVVPFVNPFVRANLKLTNNTTASVKFGSVNFVAENAFLEIKTRF